MDVLIRSTRAAFTLHSTQNGRRSQKLKAQIVREGNKNLSKRVGELCSTNWLISGHKHINQTAKNADLIQAKKVFVQKLLITS